MRRLLPPTLTKRKLSSARRTTSKKKRNNNSQQQTYWSWLQKCGIQWHMRKNNSNRHVNNWIGRVYEIFGAILAFVSRCRLSIKLMQHINFLLFDLCQIFWFLHISLGVNQCMKRMHKSVGYVRIFSSSHSFLYLLRNPFTFPLTAFWLTNFKATLYWYLTQLKFYVPSGNQFL